KHIIIYAEDDPDDLYIVQKAFEAQNEPIELRHATNGFEALQQLRRLEAENSCPCLIILDINMPGMDGRETLVQLKASESFRHVPVVLFTTSSSPRDREFAQQHGADFITKPLHFSEVEALARTFIERCNFELTENTERINQENNQ
ncbi:MAG TPA: response regulator, partial [Chitinophagaceae bacterium]|nr:response regulator [Chitinophagaceae bacterium]